MNQFLKRELGNKVHWTSFTVSKNNRVPLHKDRNNDPHHLNHSLGLGKFTGGELWVHEPNPEQPENLTPQVREDGQTIYGRKRPLAGQWVAFDPKAWHGTCSWKGERLVVTAFVGRGYVHVTPEQREELKRLGFSCPPFEEAQVLQGPRAGNFQFKNNREKEDERIKKQLYLLHAATGHSSLRNLIQALRRRNASPRVLELAKQFKCSVCCERAKVTPQHVASLEPLPPKWHTISMDVGSWQHPHSHEHINFMVIIDEGSRFRTARIVTRGAKQQPSSATCLQYLREGWTQYFGNPRCLRVDPAGYFRSQTVTDFCDRNQILHDVVPGEAHWQIGTCEQAIQGLKEALHKLAQEEPETDPAELLSCAVRVFNQQEIIRGFSPIQHAFGRAADTTGRLINEAHGMPDELQVENADGEFERNVQRQSAAEKAFSDWQAHQRLLRAAHSRARPVRDYLPGELVYFWRTQESGKHKTAPGTHKGRFLGPARVLATETKRDAQGQLRPGSAIWLVRGRQLIKCAPEHLRHASPREELIESLTSQEQRVPWTFHRVAQEIGGNQYEDLSQQAIPSAGEWRRAQDPTQEEQPVRYRMSQKRPPPPPEGDHQEEAEERMHVDEEGSLPQRPRLSQPAAQAFTAGTCWWTDVPKEHWREGPTSYWSDQAAAVEVSVDLPESNRGQQRMINNFEGFFTSALKKRNVEVCERKLNPQEYEEFRSAKLVEVKNFIAAKAFESLPPHLQPSKEQAIGMRWVLTWKTRDDGSRKAKARAVLLGYQDPSYEHRQTTAPVMTRQSRQFLLHEAAGRKWTIYKGDVSGAFLQGREYPGVLHCIPCDEICEAMNVPKGSVTRLRRACYGLVDAPLEWYRTVNEFLESLGLTRTWADSCMWVWRPQGELRGAVSGHVDDFLFGGSDTDEAWQEILRKIKARFQWGDWESKVFTQCGVQITQTEDGFELSQARYVEDHLEEIFLSAKRRQERHLPTTDREKSALRASLGALSWYSQQTAPHLSAEVGLLLSEVSQSSVDTILRTNMLVQSARARKDYVIKIRAFEPGEALCVYAWVDAGSQNRPDGGSTQGIVIGVGPLSMQNGELGHVNLISWHSNRIDRTCRSPGAAETQAAVNGEDSLYFARFQLGEMLHGASDPRDPDAGVWAIPGCVITDSRNVFDKLNTEVLAIKGAEKRSNIEMIALKEAQQRAGVTLRWVHSEAQLANSLTKAGGSKELELFYRMNFQWKIVEDPEMRSARRRKTQGLDPLDRAEGEQTTATAAAAATNSHNSISNRSCAFDESLGL